MKPVYESSTKLLIQKEAPKVINVDEVVSTDYSGRDSYLTQCKILNSRAVAKKVYEKLGGYTPWNKWRGRSGRKDVSEAEGIEAVMSHVRIKPVLNTELVEIVAEDIDPNKAAKIANTWADSYIDYMMEARFNATQSASGWLETKMLEAKDNLRSAERKLQDYRKENKIVLGADTANKVNMIDSLLAQKSELEVDLSHKLEYYKDKHPEIIGIRSEIESVNKRIEAEKDTELVYKDKEVQYSLLKRDVDTARNMYDSLLKRMSETEVSGQLRTTNVSVIDKAQVPAKPSKPKKKLNFIIAFIIGLLGGGVFALILEELDQRIKTPNDIKALFDMPLLGTIQLPERKEDGTSAPIEFVTRDMTNSPIAEGYRSLRTSILFSGVQHARKTILVTSSCPQEGKTTTSINLSIVMAQAGERTLLIDADLRRPRIEEVFGIKTEYGFSDLLAGRVSIDAVGKYIFQSGIKNLDIIACGTIPPNPSELLGAENVGTVFKTFLERYDRVIIDSPPVLAATDPVVLSSKVDGVIVVVKSSETEKKALVRVVELINTVGSNQLMGVVLNMADKNGISGGYYYYYGKYGYGNDRKTQRSVAS